MPIKKSTKSVEVSKKQVSSKSDNKKESTKKVVVKRRKTDLKPTKASAIAIASQANRAKKQALIEKVAASENILPLKVDSSNDTRIPLWVWIFFWCSLLLFCVTFYRYEFRQHIEWEKVMVNDNVDWINKSNTDENIVENNQEEINSAEINLENIDVDENEVESNQWMNNSNPDVKVVERFFDNLSNRKFDEAFDLMVLALRNSSEIRNHFTSYRMIPFLNWIDGWKLVPANFEYVNSPAYWKDVYKFDLSYVMSSDQSKYDETWEVTVNTQWNEPMISSIRCVTSKCSYHPIFWPENFGLTK